MNLGTTEYLIHYQEHKEPTDYFINTILLMYRTYLFLNARDCEDNYPT